MADGEAAGGREQALAGWQQAAAAIMWEQPWIAAYLDDRAGGRWFPGGRLNASVNCLDRHLPARADQVAVHWEGETGRPGGAPPGLDPQTVVAMLACARLGAVHAVLPASLPADALADRLSDLSPKVLVTQDGALRHGLIVPSKSRADEALAAAASVEATVVVRRVGVDVTWYEGDRWYHDLVATRRPGREASTATAGGPVFVAADHPLLIVPLAHRRGRPTWIRPPHRRLPGGGGHNPPPGPHHPARGRLLVRGRDRLDRRAEPRRLRAAGLRGDHGDERGHARRPEPGPGLGDHRALRRQRPGDHPVGGAQPAAVGRDATGPG